METSKSQTIKETIEIDNILPDGIVHTNGENKKEELAKKFTQELHSDEGNTKDD